MHDINGGDHVHQSKVYIGIREILPRAHPACDENMNRRGGRCTSDSPATKSKVIELDFLIYITCLCDPAKWIEALGLRIELGVSPESPSKGS